MRTYIKQTQQNYVECIDVSLNSSSVGRYMQRMQYIHVQLRRPHLELYLNTTRATITIDRRRMIFIICLSTLFHPFVL